MELKMLQYSLSRSKTLKLSIIIIIFLLVTSVLFMSDTVLFKLPKHHLPASCSLCSVEKHISFNNSTKVLHFRVSTSKQSNKNLVDIVIFFSHVDRNPNLKSKFMICLVSLFRHASTPLHLHILTDDSSINSTVEVLEQTLQLGSTSLQVSLYDVNKLLDPLKDLIDFIRPHFSFKQGTYYSDGIFYISVGLYKVLYLEKIIVIDADVKFLADIKNLYYYFENFSPEQMIGIALEQQPVYRHVLHDYRRLNNKTNVGDPPPNGLPGFNSGVLLLDLKKMKLSKLYNDILSNSTILLNLIEKYKFKGHLGDQDFYTLINFEYPNLFYILPCTWNRQLCQWWKRHGYKDVFELYHSCNGTTHLLHGNCNSLVPYNLDIYAL